MVDVCWLNNLILKSGPDDDFFESQAGLRLKISVLSADIILYYVVYYIIISSYHHIISYIIVYHYISYWVAGLTTQLSELRNAHREVATQLDDLKERGTANAASQTSPSPTSPQPAATPADGEGLPFEKTKSAHNILGFRVWGLGFTGVKR